MEVSILIIRQERPEDYDTVYHVVKEAFENAEYTDGNEQNLVAALRKSKSFIPELSLVAVEDEKIVGHILFTKAVVQGVEVLALAPLSVLPDYQNRGIGLSLDYLFVDLPSGDTLHCKLFPADKFHKICYLFDR